MGVSTAELLRRVLDARQGDTWIIEPGIVEKYDGAKRVVDVQPALMRPIFRDDNGDLEHERLPVIPNVPVMFLGAGDTLVTFPVAKGDEGVILITSSAMGMFREKGQVTEPGDLRRNALGSALFFPTHLSKTKVTGTQGSTNALVLSALEIRVGSKDADQKVAKAPSVQDEIDRLWAAVKTGKDSTNATLTFATDFGTCADVGSSKVKVDP